MLFQRLTWRMSAFLALAIGLAISWLASAYCYLETGFAHPIPPLLIMYTMIAYDLRWWPEMTWRVPVLMFIGSFLVLLFQPAFAARRVEYSRYEGLTHWHSPMAGVNYALVGASVFLIAIFLLAPMNSHNQIQTPKNSRSMVLH